MAEIRWILTCDGKCPDYIEPKLRGDMCPQNCPNSYYDKEQLNTEVPDAE
jgi:hypothetical protein